MSQSDYLNKKKITLQLQKQNEFSPVLNSSLYTLSKAHSIASDISNSLITRNQLTTYQSNKCSKFIVCSSTNTRQNRIQSDKAMTNILRHYIKHKKINRCEKFCYDTSINNKRLRDLCNCKVDV